MSRLNVLLVALLALAFMAPATSVAEDSAEIVQAELPLYDKDVHDDSAPGTGVRIRILAKFIAMDLGISVDEFYELNPEWKPVSDQKLAYGVILGYFTDAKPTLVASN